MLLCQGCKQNLPEDAFARDISRPSGRRYKCRACSALEFKNWQKTPGYAARLGKAKTTRRKLKDADPKRRWAQMALANARRRAKQAGLPCSIDLPWLLANSPDVCPLLEMTLQYANTKTRSDSPSIDRFDSTSGYTPENCWVISALANRIKSDATVSQLETLVGNIRLCVDKGLISVLPERKMDTPPPKRYTGSPYAA